MQIYVDTREKARAIKKILAEFERQGVKSYSNKLDVGDYMSLDNARLVVDRKQNLTEVCSNMCQQHRRFREELVRAQSRGIQLVILVEHGGTIRSIDDVEHCKIPNVPRSVQSLFSSAWPVFHRKPAVSARHLTHIRQCWRLHRQNI